MLFTSIFQFVYCIDTLREAYYQCRPLERHQKQFAWWEAIDEAELHSLSNDLRHGSYIPEPASHAVVKDKRSGKSRDVYAPKMRDKVVEAALNIVLQPIFEPTFADFSIGCRPVKCTKDALLSLKQAELSGSILKIDISNCFMSIPRDVVMRLLEKRISDRRVLALLRLLINRKVVMQNGKVATHRKGILPGLVIAPLCCNIFLNDVIDRWWIEFQSTHGLRGLLYRYVDDMPIRLDCDAAFYDVVYPAIEQRLAQYGMRISEKKSDVPRREGKKKRQVVLGVEIVKTKGAIAFRTPPEVAADLVRDVKAKARLSNFDAIRNVWNGHRNYYEPFDAAGTLSVWQRCTEAMTSVLRLGGETEEGIERLLNTYLRPPRLVNQ